MAESQEEEGITIIPEPPEVDELDESDEPVGEVGDAADTWSLVRSKVAAAAAAAQRPLHYFIGCENSCEGIVEALQAPVSIAVPKWALVSMVGLGIAVFWQQERRVRVCLTIMEQHQAGLLRLAEMFVSCQSSAQQVAEAAAADRATMAVQQTRQSGVMGAVMGMGAASLLLLSDERLKSDIRRLPGTLGGCPLYSWKWSRDAEVRFGLSGTSCGVIAQEVSRLRPEAAHRGYDGYIRVDYMTLLR